MSQYYPPRHFERRELNEMINADDYRCVTDEMEKLGLDNGWLQEYGSSDNYRPDFDKDHPFEDK
jgi:putative pyruvate formate lyase activating enzyme